MKKNKILMTSPSFFGYEYKIKKGLEAKGYIVSFFDERGSGSTLNKILIRLKLNISKKFIDSYFKHILEEIKDDVPDILFSIKAEALPSWFIDELKKLNPNLKTILYLFDSVKNYPDVISKANKFDAVYTFDRRDSIMYSWTFRPLFFDEIYSNSKADIVKEKYDVVFIGTLHSDRYRVINKIIEQVSNVNRNSFVYYYIPLKSMFYYNKYIKGDFKDVTRKEVTTVSLSQNEVARIIKESKCVVDVQHPDQSGLTMRTIETLGARKKLITTNKDICNYDLFNPNNILVVDRNCPKIDLDWLNIPYQEIPENLYYYYSLSGFLSTIID